ncbi:hypothetical protein BJP47_30230 [Paenibacillus odorifer]|nr:hypothetical protein BJP47_30230 [Paenibacillus odorifer]
MREKRAGENRSHTTPCEAPRLPFLLRFPPLKKAGMNFPGLLFTSLIFPSLPFCATGYPFLQSKKDSEWNSQDAFPWLVAFEFAGWWGFTANKFLNPCPHLDENPYMKLQLFNCA